MKKNIIITVVVLVFSLVGIIISNNNFSYAKEDNKDLKLSVYFDNLKTSIVNGTAYVPMTPEVDSTSIKAYDVLISKKGDYATFTFDVINDGDIDATLNSLTKIEPKCISLLLPANEEDEKEVCNNLEYKIYYSKNNKEVSVDDIIKSKTKESITIKIGLNDNFNYNLEGDVQITLFDTNFVFSKK